MEPDCQNCGAPKIYSEYVDVFRCEHCGTVHLPAAGAFDGVEILEARSDTSCPLCRCAFRHATAEQWNVLQCQSAPEC